MTLYRKCGRLAAAALPVLLLGPGLAHATNGYFSHGYSVAQRAMGGAGTAYASDALTVSANPANLAFVPERLDVNLGLFVPIRHYAASERGPDAGPGIVTIEPGQIRSLHERFVIPAVAYSRPYNENITWGIAMYGNGGMNTDYHGSSARFAQGLTGFETQCKGTLGGGRPVDGASDNAGFCGNRLSNASVDFIQMFIVPSVAYRIGESASVGVAPVVAAQRFKAQGLSAFSSFSNDPDKVSDNGSDLGYGVGYRAGFSIGVLPDVTFGASYQSRIRMTAFDKYAGLFADRGAFDVPSTWNAGVAIDLPWQQRLLIDVQEINYSEILAVGLPMDPNRFVNGCAIPRLGGDTSRRAECLGSASGPGFGWRDVTTHKFGYEIDLQPLRLRAGYSRNRQPIPSTEVLFNILAPAVPQEHFTFGASWPVADSWDLDFSATFAKTYPVSGKNPLSNSQASEAELFAEVASPGSGNTDNAFGPDPDDQDITLKMRQYELFLGWSYRF